MRALRSPRAARRWSNALRTQGIPIAFVPTMGCLHDGHISLVHHARRKLGSNGRVIVSVYVNPTQFAPGEDFARYPRNLKRDAALCRAAGVDALFIPQDKDMYPYGADGPASTYVLEEELARHLEGVSRPTHFRGVTTVVTKLFVCIQPDIAVFGAKDWQQAMIVRRMTRDLLFPTRILVAPTLREPDGLAMSSRNQYLNDSERREASVLWEVIQEARRMVRQSPSPIPAAQLLRDLQKIVDKRSLARTDYIEFFDSNTLVPSSHVHRGTHLALAVRFGKTRLIDNAPL
jgi:pantoate--beta-alanine ligase